MAYQIRDDKGILIAVVDNRAAGKIISETSGHWTEKNYTQTGRATVFILDEDMSWSVGGLKVFLWAGFYLRAE